MKIDRLLSILTYLLENGSATAPELAEKFEVSKRTVLRDIDSLGRAGFPVVSTQGRGGGIALMEGFSLDRRALKKEDLSHIISGLKGLDSISSDGQILSLLGRLSPANESFININLSSFYKESLSSKIDDLKEAANKKVCVSFEYYSPGKKEKRLIEPIRVEYRWSDWYVYGYCRAKEDFRFFKLNRLWNLSLAATPFDMKEIPPDRDEPGSHLSDHFQLEVLFDESTEHLLVESYGPGSYVKSDDGFLHFSIGYTNKDYILRWLLGFGDKALVIDPPYLADELKNIAANMVKKYSAL